VAFLSQSILFFPAGPQLALFLTENLFHPSASKKLWGKKPAEIFKPRIHLYCIQRYFTQIHKKKLEREEEQ